ncbi:hypothetical protein [Evansella halocellulosilytica]|uniref:hypothetical protein n=1 Tax=Evansella halocellulosilytica TaxID=2011013 RepID=UPI001155431A|nr:hypothetical protein [Evansella halocellulosilytica]
MRHLLMLYFVCIRSVLFATGKVGVKSPDGSSAPAVTRRRLHASSSAPAVTRRRLHASSSAPAVTRRRLHASSSAPAVTRRRLHASSSARLIEEGNASKQLIEKSEKSRSLLLRLLVAEKPLLLLHFVCSSQKRRL